MLNKVQLIGNAGSDPDVKDLNNGNKVANFTVATSERYKDKEGNKQEKTEWHRVVCFGKVAEIVEKYLRKGAQLYIEGKIQTRQWEDKEGVKKYTTEIIAQTFRLLGRKGDNEGSSSAQSSNTSSSTPSSSSSSNEKKAPALAEPSVMAGNDNDDDLPF